MWIKYLNEHIINNELGFSRGQFYYHDKLLLTIKITNSIMRRRLLHDLYYMVCYLIIIIVVGMWVDIKIKVWRLEWFGTKQYNFKQQI